MSTCISRVRDVISAPRSALCKQYRVDRQQHARGSRNTQCATSPRSRLPTWPNTSHLHTCIQTLFSVSIARGFFTWSVPRLLGATPKFKFVLSQLFRTIVLLFASSFISRLERERLVFVLSSSRPLDCEAVIQVGTLSLVQFVGLTVITVTEKRKQRAHGTNVNDWMLFSIMLECAIRARQKTKIVDGQTGHCRVTVLSGFF